MPLLVNMLSLMMSVVNVMIRESIFSSGIDLMYRLDLPPCRSI